MTLEQAKAELREVGLTIEQVVVHDVMTGAQHDEFAVVPLGDWPSFDPLGVISALVWFPTWEGAYAAATDRSPF